MADANRVGLTPLGQKLERLHIKLNKLNGSGGACLACHCSSAELIELLESEGLDSKEVEAEAQKIAFDFMFVLPNKHESLGRLSSESGRCGDAAYIPNFLAACYAVMSRK